MVNVVFVSQCSHPSVKAASITFEFFGVIAVDWEFDNFTKKGKKMVIPYASIAYIEYLSETEKGR